MAIKKRKKEIRQKSPWNSSVKISNALLQKFNEDCTALTQGARKVWLADIFSSRNQT